MQKTNKNNETLYGNISKGVALATATSLVLGNVAYAADAVPPSDTPAEDITPGSLAGILSEAATMHNDILAEPEAITAADITAEAIEEAASEALDSTEEVEETIEEAVEETENIEEETAEETENIEEEAVENTDEASLEELNRDFSQAGGLLMADVQTALNVRSLPSMKGEILGQMRPTDTAEIVSFVDGWYEITSGAVKGFVSGDYALVGPDSAERKSVLSDAYVTCNVRKLNVRTDASTDSEVLEKIKYNETLIIDQEAEEVEGWVGIKTDDFTGYVSEEYVEVYDGELGTAITADEIEEERKKRWERMRLQSPVLNSAVSASADDLTLLAALLICEAGGSYDGMLAVGGVVMNRLRAGYAGDIRGVIYQSGQFSPVRSGKLDSVLASGVNENAISAAQQALSGVDITGGCKNFRAAFTGHPGTNIGGNVFF